MPEVAVLPGEDQVEEFMPHGEALPGGVKVLADAFREFFVAELFRRLVGCELELAHERVDLAVFPLRDGIRTGGYMPEVQPAIR